ncbi:MAG TPA: serine hydrolase [Armatimonadota bacterium]|nr:serine hydrolase [Armatimonadota bacterium]HQK92999.1 serine hydrolase [Armatimonadota bacterium]
MRLCLGVFCALLAWGGIDAVAQAPAAADRPLAGKTIVVDPSHGLKDAAGTVISAGAVGPGGVSEAEVVLRVAEELRVRLESFGAAVVLTRSVAQPWRIGDDPRDDAMARARSAAQCHAAAFVRLHADAATDPSTRGPVVLFFTDESRALAHAIFDALTQPASGQGVFKRYDYGLEACTAPAVSVGLGVVSNPHDERVLATDTFQKQAAQAISQALVMALTTPAPAEHGAAPPLVSDPEGELGEENVDDTGTARVLAQCSQRLLQSVLAITNRTPWHVGLVARNLATGEATWIRPDTPFPAAQLVGLPVMAETTRQIREGKLKPGVAPPGGTRTVFQLTQAMIIGGDLTAADALIGLLGLDSIDSTASLLGMTATSVQRKPGDVAAKQRGLENLTTPDDLARMLEQVAIGQSVSGEASKAMYEMLRRHANRQLIPAGVPAEAEVANLTASQPGLIADAAIVRTPFTTYVLVVFLRDVEGRAGGPDPAGLIPEVSRAVYEHFARTYLAVDTRPPGLKVFVNDRLKGIAPCLIQITSATPQAQEFTIAARADDGRTARRVVVVSQGDRQAVQLSLD